MESFHGIESAFYGAGYDLKQFFKSISVKGERAVYDASTLSTLWKIFRAGRVNGELTAEGLHSTGANELAAVFAAIRGTKKTFMVLPEGNALGYPFAGMYGSVIGQSIESKLADMNMSVMNVQAKTGVDLGWILKEHAAVTSTASTTGVDTLASMTRGGAFYLQCTAYTGTAAKLVVKLEDSADNSSWADVAGIATAAADIVANYSVRIPIPKTTTLRRYLRVTHTVTAGLTSASIICGVSKYYT